MLLNGIRDVLIIVLCGGALWLIMTGVLLFLWKDTMDALDEKDRKKSKYLIIGMFGGLVNQTTLATYNVLFYQTVTLSLGKAPAINAHRLVKGIAETRGGTAREGDDMVEDAFTTAALALFYVGSAMTLYEKKSVEKRAEHLKSAKKFIKMLEKYPFWGRVLSSSIKELFVIAEKKVKEIFNSSPKKHLPLYCLDSILEIR